MPIAMQPLPGTVVKVCAASIVRRIYCRFSTAPESIGVGPASRGRFGVALIVPPKVTAPGFLSSTLHHKANAVRELLRRTTRLSVAKPLGLESIDHGGPGQH